MFAILFKALFSILIIFPNFITPPQYLTKFYKNKSFFYKEKQNVIRFEKKLELLFGLNKKKKIILFQYGIKLLLIRAWLTSPQYFYENWL